MTDCREWAKHKETQIRGNCFLVRTCMHQGRSYSLSLCNPQFGYLRTRTIMGGSTRENPILDNGSQLHVETAL